MAKPGDELTRKDLFTTGEAARICNVSQQTIIRCFDRGDLEGFRVPGSRTRRIPRDALVRFMQRHQMSLEPLEQMSRRVLVVDADSTLADRLRAALGEDGPFVVKTASNGFDAGVLTATFKPEFLVVAGPVPAFDLPTLERTVRAAARLRRAVLLLARGGLDDPLRRALASSDRVAVLRDPVDVTQIVKRIRG